MALVELLNFTRRNIFVLLISHKEKRFCSIAHSGDAGAHAVALQEAKYTNWVRGASAVASKGPL